MSVLRALAMASMLAATLAVADDASSNARKTTEPAAAFEPGASNTLRTAEPAGESESLLSRIPEPGTLGLIIAGLAVMVFVARRQPRD